MSPRLLTIFLVYGNPSVRALIRLFLTRECVVVITEDNGRTALELGQFYGRALDPGAAWLDETVQLNPFRVMPLLLNVWFVVLGAFAGLCAGRATLRHACPWLGSFFVIMNTPVIALQRSLASFLSLGGSH